MRVCVYIHRYTGDNNIPGSTNKLLKMWFRISGL